MMNVRKKSCLIVVGICLLFSPGVWANALLLTTIFNNTGKALTVTINGKDYLVNYRYVSYVNKPVLADIPPGQGVETHGSIKVTGAGLSQYSSPLVYKYEGGGLNQYWGVQSNTSTSTAIGNVLLEGKAYADIVINLEHGQPVPHFKATNS